jgi:hypothetical protein
MEQLKSIRQWLYNVPYNLIPKSDFDSSIFGSLPVDILANIIFYLDIFDVIHLMRTSLQLRSKLIHSKIWCVLFRNYFSAQYSTICCEGTTVSDSTYRKILIQLSSGVHNLRDLGFP